MLCDVGFMNTESIICGPQAPNTTYTNRVSVSKELKPKAAPLTDERTIAFIRSIQLVCSVTEDTILTSYPCVFPILFNATTKASWSSALSLHPTGADCECKYVTTGFAFGDTSYSSKKRARFFLIGSHQNLEVSNSNAAANGGQRSWLVRPS